MLSYDAMYAVIAIVVSMLVVSEWLRDLTVRVLTRMIGAIKGVFPQAFKFAKFVVCAAVLYATLPALHSFAVVEIAKQGGIDAIIKALGNHPDHAEVQRLGSMLLERFRQVGSMALERFDIQITAAGAA